MQLNLAQSNLLAQGERFGLSALLLNRICSSDLEWVDVDGDKQPCFPYPEVQVRQV